MNAEPLKDVMRHAKRWTTWVCSDCEELRGEKELGHSKSTKLGLYNRTRNEVSIKRADVVRVIVKPESTEIIQSCRKCGYQQTLELAHQVIHRTNNNHKKGADTHEQVPVLPDPNCENGGL